MPKQETKTSIIIFNPDEGFLRVSSKAGIDNEIEDARRDFELGKKMVNHRKIPVLADSRMTVNHSKEVRDFYASEERAQNISAMAILVDSAGTRMIANFFLKVNKPFFPTKLFTNEHEAVIWLNRFL